MLSQSFQFVLLSLVAYRLWRFIGRDTLPPLAWLRDYLETQIAERWGEDWADGISCPWCLGSWVAFGVVAVTAQFVIVIDPVLQAIGVACVVGLLGKNLDG